MNRPSRSGLPQDHDGRGEGTSMKAETFLPGGGCIPAEDETEEYTPKEDEPFMNERQLEYFRRKLLNWKNSTARREQADDRGAAGQHPQHPRHRRPCQRGDRPRAGTAHPGPAAQACRQDRRGAAADRGRRVRLLRGDGRPDLAQAARRAADRDAEPRGAGAPRAAREGAPRRLSCRGGGRRRGLRRAGAKAPARCVSVGRSWSWAAASPGSRRRWRWQGGASRRGCWSGRRRWARSARGSRSRRTAWRCWARWDLTQRCGRPGWRRRRWSWSGPRTGGAWCAWASPGATGC